MSKKPYSLALTFVLERDTCQEIEERFPAGDLTEAGSVSLWACKLVDHLAYANRVLLGIPDFNYLEWKRSIQYTDGMLLVEFTRDPA